MRFADTVLANACDSMLFFHANLYAAKLSDVHIQENPLSYNESLLTQVRIIIPKRAIVQANLSEYPAALTLQTNAASVTVEVHQRVECGHALLTEPEHRV